jgi:hypothetical protein
MALLCNLTLAADAAVDVTGDMAGDAAARLARQRRRRRRRRRALPTMSDTRAARATYGRYVCWRRRSYTHEYSGQARYRRKTWHHQ